MLRRVIPGFVLGLSILAVGTTPAQQATHKFAIAEGAFRLDGQPLQIISGEMHFARIPREYWRHRLRMAKAMGLNTIATYVFWNYHESRPGVFDFRTGNRDLATFVRLAQDQRNAIRRFIVKRFTTRPS